MLWVVINEALSVVMVQTDFLGVLYKGLGPFNM
jgi:hypothetical protein